MLAHEVKGTGEAVTLLHGFLQDRSSWSEVVGRMPGRRILLVDLPGHGGSAREPATLPAAAAALDALWSGLRIERTHLVGYSMGGRIALYTALTHPRRLASLFTLGAHAGFAGAARDARRREDAALAARVEAEGIDWLAGHWASLPLFAGLRRRGPGLLARLDQMRRAQDAQGIAAALRGMGGAAEEPFWERLDTIERRATFAAGALDERYVAHARRLAGRVRDSRLELIPDAGHAAHLEQPDAFVRALEDHLSTR